MHSAPVFAGMVSLINTIRLNNNMPPVGFANPVLYQFKDRIANDIDEGDNRCTSNPSKCCSQGFHATKGWDPASGIGSIDFANLLELFSTSVPGG
jgi:tripeptidyl-peptidase-1